MNTVYLNVEKLRRLWDLTRIFHRQGKQLLHEESHNTYVAGPWSCSNPWIGMGASSRSIDMSATLCLTVPDQLKKKESRWWPLRRKCVGNYTEYARICNFFFWLPRCDKWLSCDFCLRHKYCLCNPMAANLLKITRDVNTGHGRNSRCWTDILRIFFRIIPYVHIHQVRYIP
jgi:hypothetical protein